MRLHKGDSPENGCPGYRLEVDGSVFAGRGFSGRTDSIPKTNCGGATMVTQRIHRMLCLLSAAFLIAMSLGTGRAQSGSQGTIAVTVVDASGGLVPKATLSLIDQSTNDTRHASTHENGTYTFVNLTVGTYRLKAE